MADQDTIKGFAAKLKIRTEAGLMADYDIGKLSGCTPTKAKRAMLSVVRTLATFLITAGHEEELDKVIADVKARDPRGLMRAVTTGE